MNTYIKYLICTFFSGLFLAPNSSRAQTEEEGKWWPHPLWGAEDQAGASNWNTPEKVLQAVSLVKTGKVYELGNVYDEQMPLIGSRSYELTVSEVPTHGPSGAEQVVFNDEFLATQIGQVGTQFDGPGHVGKRMKVDSGEETEVFYNGFTTDDIKSPTGLKHLGVEHVKPYVTRGIMLDIAAARGLTTVEVGYVATLADVHKALDLQGMSEADFRPGDALLFNFGWWKNWPDPNVLKDTPYISREVVDWIIQRQPSMVGSDATLDGGLRPNVHIDLTLKNGIWNLEWMRFDHMVEDRMFEFLFIYTPIRFKGATGSPGRPIAVG
ncbi:MAG: cyclase family protein [Saprospiraceae bacterium]|nr:cyclase family protein [Saprospiraceae bacterium]